MAESSIKVSLEIIDKAASKALSNFITQSGEADKGLNKLQKSGQSAFTEIGVHIGKASGLYDIFVGNLAANLATKAFDALTDSAKYLFKTFIVDGIAAAKAQEEATNSLNVALAQSGIYSTATAKEFEELANQIQATTGIEDDAVLTNAALIQSLGQLDKDGLKRATLAAIDLSAALGKDLTSASEAIGKAATGNVTALQKMGLTIEKGSNDAETFENTLRALEDRFSGSAVAKVNTYGGAVRITSSAFGDLQEKIGNTIVQNNVVIETMKALAGSITDTTGGIKSQSQAWKEVVGGGILIALQATNLFIVGLDTLVRFGTSGFNTLASLVDNFNSRLYGMTDAIGLTQGKAAEFYQKALAEHEKSKTALTQDETLLGNISTTLSTMEAAANKGFLALKSGASTSVAPLNNTKAKVAEITTEQKKLNDEIIKWGDNLAKSATSGEGVYKTTQEQLDLTRDSVVNSTTATNEEKLAAQLAYNEQIGAAEDARFATELAKIETYHDLKKNSEQQYLDANLAAERDHATKTAKIAQTKKELEEKFNKERSENFKGTLSYISSLQSSSVREFFEIGKAAAIATATIDGYAAVQKALASAPPPFNFILAGLVGVATASNVAKISQQQPPAFEQGGIVPGNSFSGDRVAAQVNSGEMILNRGQQKQLFDVANGASSASNSQVERLLGAVNALLSQPLAIQINGREIINVTRSELLSGRSFA
jgi:hypothetical protein